MIKKTVLALLLLSFLFILVPNASAGAAEPTWQAFQFRFDTNQGAIAAIDNHIGVNGTTNVWLAVYITSRGNAFNNLYFGLEWKESSGSWTSDVVTGDTANIRGRDTTAVDGDAPSFDVWATDILDELHEDAGAADYLNTGTISLDNAPQEWAEVWFAITAVEQGSPVTYDIRVIKTAGADDFTGAMTNYDVAQASITVYPSAAAPTCDCPSSGNWEINDGSNCTLDTECNLPSGSSLHISDGSLTIVSGVTLNVPTGGKIIIDNVGTNKLVIEDGGNLFVHQSPFLYFFNGSNYVMLSDFIAGATSPEKEYTSFTDITGTEINGEIKLKITEELDETAYIDKYNLVVYDYPLEKEEEFSKWLDKSFEKINEFNWKPKPESKLPDYVDYTTLNSQNQSSLTLNSDSRYLEMEKGASKELKFNLRKATEKTGRRIFFTAEGYYIEHPQKKELIAASDTAKAKEFNPFGPIWPNYAYLNASCKQMRGLWR